MAELFCGGAIGERGSSGYESEERWPPEKLGLCREGGYLDAPVTGQVVLRVGVDLREFGLEFPGASISQR